MNEALTSVCFHMFCHSWFHFLSLMKLTDLSSHTHRLVFNLSTRETLQWCNYKWTIYTRWHKDLVLWKRLKSTNCAARTAIYMTPERAHCGRPRCYQATTIKQDFTQRWLAYILQSRYSSAIVLPGRLSVMFTGETSIQNDLLLR